MKKASGVLIILIVLLGVYSCKDSLVVSDTDQSVVDLINGFKNVPWKLKSATAGDSALPFYLEVNKFTFLFNDTAIFGHDGCNYFDGIYTIGKECFNITGIRQTQMACYPYNLFEACWLIRTWNCTFTDSSFTLFKNDTIFNFSSNYAHSLSNFSVLNKKWKLIATNNDKYSYLRSVGNGFSITLLSDRSLTIRKINTDPSTEYDCTYSSIYFGIGVNNSISIYSRRYTTSCIGAQPAAENMSRDLVKDLLTMTNYSATNTTMTLTRSSDGRFYTFDL